MDALTKQRSGVFNRSYAVAVGKVFGLLKLVAYAQY